MQHIESRDVVVLVTQALREADGLHRNGPMDMSGKPVEGADLGGPASCFKTGEIQNTFETYSGRPIRRHTTNTLNPFITAAPFWEQTAQIRSSLSPKRDRGLP